LLLSLAKSYIFMLNIVVVRNNDLWLEIEIRGPIIHSFMNVSVIKVNEKLIMSSWHLIAR
jgi:hypothetical protein